MSYSTLWLIAIGLSMDAFAVAVTKGLSLTKFCWKFALSIAFCFGFFQALMPFIGYHIGSQFSDYIQEIDHWVAFVLLAFIGGKMIKESFSDAEEDDAPSDFSFKHLVTLGIATSVDALAMGISFAFLKVNICTAVGLIGFATAVICIFGVKAGHWLGAKIRKQAEFLGGVMLFAIGIHILIEHHAFG